ncbi:MAG: hypothetical protein KJ771_03100 [Nanoarchaeota archaeon]|nr:hypothetical protein [Nanoarchaeota archaeon]
MKKEIPLRIGTFLDQKEINFFLDSIPPVPVAPIKLAFYAIDERYSFLEIFEEWKPSEFEGTKLNQISETEKFSLYKFEIGLPDKFKKKCPKCNEEFFESELSGENSQGITYFLRFKKIPFVIVLSNSHFKESDYVFSFFNRYYPFLTRIFLRAKQLGGILKQIENTNMFGEQVYSQDFILKKYYAGKETERHYKKRDFESIFAEAKQKGLWLDNITFRVEEKGRIQLSRDGKVQYYDDFIFSDMHPLIDLIINTYLQSYDILNEANNRRKDGKITSIKIILDEPAFVESEDCDSFLKYLNSYKESDVTILSRNGPFFEASLVDYKTGSSIDICVYDSKIITIIPQFQVTTIPLVNLINYILEEYDGKVEI